MLLSGPQRLRPGGRSSPGRRAFQDLPSPSSYRPRMMRGNGVSHSSCHPVLRKPERAPKVNSPCAYVMNPPLLLGYKKSKRGDDANTHSLHNPGCYIQCNHFPITLYFQADLTIYKSQCLDCVHQNQKSSLALRFLTRCLMVTTLKDSMELSVQKAFKKTTEDTR